ncbi:MAG: class I SAM-dependent methyltransferase [Thermodesulfobacteriota bacterium]|nr:class I SAM-dependent methyltransferase [Thermodesulfobacteriota bacterium]
MNSPSKDPTEQEVQRINEVQRDFFSKLTHVFDPPLPEGVPERLKKIVAAGRIDRGNVVLDVGTGTGILVPLIQEYEPETIYGCDLSEAMLTRLKEQYPYVITMAADVRDLMLPDMTVDVVFVNACYPNIVDKTRSLANIGRMINTGGRLVISHPMGKSFIDHLKSQSPFPLDDFPERLQARALLQPHGFEIQEFVDEPQLYILLAVKGSGG